MNVFYLDYFFYLHQFMITYLSIEPVLIFETIWMPFIFLTFILLLFLYPLGNRQVVVSNLSLFLFFLIYLFVRISFLFYIESLLTRLSYFSNNVLVPNALLSSTSIHYYYPKKISIKEISQRPAFQANQRNWVEMIR